MFRPQHRPVLGEHVYDGRQSGQEVLHELRGGPKQGYIQKDA